MARRPDPAESWLFGPAYDALVASFDTYAPLNYWLSRNPLVPHLADPKLVENPNLELGGFVTLENSLPLHDAIDLPGQDLDGSWHKTVDYVRRANGLFASAPGSSTLDTEEAIAIHETLGPPPAVCTPIYLITVSDARRQTVVYVGKHGSKSPRFRGGHGVATRLHHPKYGPFSKGLILCSVTFMSADYYIPIEWVRPLSYAQELLASVEAQLIYAFRPEFNKAGRSNYGARLPLTIHIQDFASTRALGPTAEDDFVFPLR